MAEKQVPESIKSSSRSAPSSVSDDAAALQSFGFNVATDMGVAWIEALSDMGSEVLSFVSDRIKEDVKTQHRILHCRDVNELQEIQTEFVQKAIDQYQAETGKIIEMSQRLIAPSGGKTND